MKPNGKRVVIELLSKESPTLVIIDSSKDKPLRGKVIAVGDCETKVGDIVYVNPFAGDDLKYEGKDCKIIREESILLYE